MTTAVEPIALNGTPPPGNGKGPDPTLDSLEEAMEGDGGTAERESPSGWFPRLAQWYIRRRYRHGIPVVSAREAARAETDRAESAITWACIRSSVTGAAAGSLSTLAALVTAETEGFGGIIAVPAALVSIGGEMLYRSVVHLELTCQLADIFGVPIDPEQQDDIFRVYGLIFRTEKEKKPEQDDPGAEMVHRVADVEVEEVGESIGSKVLGESVARNVLPVVGIVVSSVTNWRLTSRLGNTVRRYMRYQRAFTDAFARAEAACDHHFDLLVEGIWFIFTADGRLNHEEAAILGRLLQQMSPEERAAIRPRFTEDEYDWADRLRSLPDEVRDSFLHALEVAAAVDKDVSLPERKILRRAYRKLDRDFDPKRLDRMMQEFEDVGVLSPRTHDRPTHDPTGT